MSRQQKRTPQHVLPRGPSGRLSYALMHLMHKDIYDNVAALAALGPDDVLLDIACGDGHFLEKYASHASRVAGLDLSQLGVDRASRRLADRVASGKAELVCSDASRLPWRDGEFSVVTEMGTLPVFPAPEDTLREICRVLRPKGRAVLCIAWNAEDGKDHSKHTRKYGYRVWSEADVLTMFRQAGFASVDITYATADGMPKMMLVTAKKEG